MRLNPDHVGALNLVEIEFYGQKPVIDAWKAYWSHLGKRVPADQPERDVFFKERESLLTKLLHAMARSLDFQIEQLDIFEGGYVPQGWEEEEQLTRLTRFLLLDVLNGKRGIPVVPINLPTQNSPYPPAPES